LDFFGIWTFGVWRFSPVILNLIYRSLRQHALSTLVTAGSIALAAGLLLTVWVVKTQSQSVFAATNSGFDAVLDFDRVVRDPESPDVIQQAYGCGDGVHPSPIGYFQMGKSVDLGLFGK